MTVKSMFDFKFPEAAREEGLRLTHDVGTDMVPLDGYLDHEVLQDATDAGHFMVNTHWASAEQANAVLKKYNEGAKIKRANELIPGGPTGFVGNVLSTD